jgi:hypothetical protein
VLKSHLRIYAILIPLVIIARYVLFRDAGEFTEFASALKTYITPLVIALAVLAIAVLSFSVIRKIDQKLQRRLVNLLFWTSTILLTTSIAAVFTYVKFAA